MEGPSRSQKIYIACASLFAIAFGLMLLLASLFNIEAFKSAFTSLPGQNFITSLVLVFSGVSIYALITEKVFIQKYVSVFFAFLVLVLSGILISHEWISYGIQFDQLISSGIDSTIQNPRDLLQGRIVNLGKLCIFLFGLSIIAQSTKHGTIELAAQLVLNTITVFTFAAILGHLFNVPQFINLAHRTSMTIQIAVGYFILSIAGTLIHPNIGITGLFTGTSIGSKLGRRFFIQLAIAISILSYLRFLDHRLNVLPTELGNTLLVLFLVLTCLVLIWRTSGALDLFELKKFQTEGDLVKVSTFLNATPDPIVIVNGSGIIQAINKQTEQIFGYKQEELIGQPVEILVPFKFKQGHINHRASFVNDPKARSMGWSKRLFASKKDGTEIPVEVSLNPVRMENETWVAAAIRDITERDLLQEDIKLSNERFLTFFNMSPIPTLITQIKDGTIENVNDAFLKMFSHDRSIIGKTPHQIGLISAEDQNKLIALLLKNQMRVTDFEATLKDANSLIKYIIFSTEMILLNKQNYGITTIIDISERIQNEKNLNQISERLKLATNYSSIGIWDFDIQNNVLLWDSLMLELYGIKKEEFSGAYDTWQNSLYPDDKILAISELQKAISGEKVYNTHYRIIWPDQSIHFIKAKGRVEFNESGTPIRMLGTNWDITKQKLAEEELLLSNQRNRIFVEQAPRAMAMFDTDMCYMAASQQWLKDYQLGEIDIVGRSHYELFPEIKDEWKQLHQKCLQGAIDQCDEAPFERADGSIQWLTWDVRPWYLSEDTIGGLIMYTADITQLKQKDQERRRIEEILDKTNEIARIGTWEVDLNSGQVIWSRITREIHEVPDGYEPNLETAINFFTPGESHRKINQAVAVAIEKGTPYDVEVELITYKGNQTWTRAIGQSEFTNGTCTRLYGVFQDIDQIKRSEQQLNRANEELRAIFNSGPVGIIGTDLNGIINHFNKGSEDMLQYTSAELVGKESPALFHKAEEILKRGEELTNEFGRTIGGLDVFVELARQGEYETREWTYVRKNGTTVNVLLTIAALRDERNEISGFLGMAIDISKRVEAQQKLIETKGNLELLTKRLTAQNERLANFAHITSHNLRSPVSNLNTLVHFYKTSESDEDKAILFEKFETVIHHLSETLNSLVDALKIRSDAKNAVETIAFEQVFEKTKEILTGQIMETKAEIIGDFSEINQIEYNRSYLESILLNLVSNAIKYRDLERTPIIQLKTYFRNKKTILTVSDNGLGINLERHHHKIFGLHKTFHRNPDARGVGLFLTKTQIEAMGGTISVGSEVGKGTIFTIKF